MILHILGAENQYLSLVVVRLFFKGLLEVLHSKVKGHTPILMV